MAEPNRNESDKQIQNISLEVKNQMVTDLKQVLKEKVKLDPEQVKMNNAILKEFLESLTTEIKKMDPEFKAFFKRIYYTGSVYEGLRIKSDKEFEFDINIVLELFKPADREIEYQREVYTFVKYKIKDSPSEEIYNLFFEREYLSPKKVKIWMQSVVDKVINRRMLKIENVQEIKMSESGPAKTIKLKTSFKKTSCNDTYTISIDLVPVIEFSYSEWQHGANREDFKKFEFNLEEQCGFLVPKDFERDGIVKEWDVQCLWRLHFPGIEKKIIHDLGCVKPLIKLLKLLRDKENWNFASYDLKTVLLWMVMENSENSESIQKNHWKEDKMGERFVEVLKKLDSYVEEKHIPYFFYPNFNLLKQMNSSNAENIHCRLQRIINSIERDPSNLKTMFDQSKTTKASE